MSDLRDYTFGDWFRIFIKVIPAYFLASLAITLPFLLPLALLYLLTGSAPR